MKKVISIILALTILFGLTGCSKNKIPSITEVSEMKYSEINEVLAGKNIQEIRDLWGEPAESDGKEDTW